MVLGPAIEHNILCTVAKQKPDGDQQNPTKTLYQMDCTEEGSQGVTWLREHGEAICSEQHSFHCSGQHSG